MKKITILLASLISLVSFSQEQERGFKIDNFSTSIGFTINKTNELSLDHLVQLAPESSLLNENGDLLGNRSSVPADYSNGLNELQLNVSLKNMQRSNHRLQFGITYQQRNLLGRSDAVTRRYTIDSLESQQYGNTYPVDSFVGESISSTYDSEILRIMGSYRIHKELNEKWSLYGGLGLSAALSFNNFTKVNYHEYSAVIFGIPDNNPAQGSIPIEHSNRETEVMKNENGFSAGAFVPLGIDYTIGDWKSKVNSLSIFLEAQPGYYAQYVPEISSFYGGFFSTQTIGIRIGL